LQQSVGHEALLLGYKHGMALHCMLFVVLLL